MRHRAGINLPHQPAHPGTLRFDPRRRTLSVYHVRRRWRQIFFVSADRSRLTHKALDSLKTLYYPLSTLPWDLGATRGYNECLLVALNSAVLP